MKSSAPFVVLVAALLVLSLPCCTGAEDTPGEGGGKAEKEEESRDIARSTKGKVAMLEEADTLMKQARESVAELDDYTAVFHKREYVDGELLPEEVIRMKVKLDPRRIYMRWIGDQKADQELLWGEDWNDGRIMARAGGLLGLITVNLDPEGKKAMKDNRHSVKTAGFRSTIKLLEEDLTAALEHPENVEWVEDLGKKEIYGQQARGFDIRLQKEEHPDFYGYRSRVWIHTDLKLPVRVKIWDREDDQVRLIENYGYEKIKVNVGLTGEDFDPDNPEYGF
ncbi:MAG: DUF1571 domain-containing protein [Candidatus Brocadiia bacterium]